jgi:hypothetical protein
MAYIASKLAVSATGASANSTAWVTVVETATINIVQGTNNKVRVFASWIGASATISAGDFRVVLHTDDTGDTQVGDEVAIPLLTSFSAVHAVEGGGLVAGPVGALHKAKLQIRAGATILSTADSGRAWIEMTYANT